MATDAEAYRRREIGSKRMEEEAKKIQPLRPLSAAENDDQYPLAAKGGSIKRFDVGGSNSISLDDLNEALRDRAPTIPEQFNRYIAPHIQRGMDAMFPFRQLIQRKFENNVYTPLNESVVNNIGAAIKTAGTNQSDAEDARAHMANAARRAVGMAPQPIPFDPSKALGDINAGEFDPENVSSDKNYERLLEAFLKKRAQAKANGGQVDMDRMRLELMNKGGLSKQERRANRKKFMEPSKDKRRFYHGSKEPNIVEFKTRKQIADENYPDDPSNDYRDERNAVFLSPDPKFTRHFSVEGYTDTGQAPTTYPVHVQARNPFDFDNPKHRENLWKTYHDIYYNPESELYAHGPHDTASEKTLAEMRMKKRIYESHKDENNWPLFENPNVQEAIQDMGHDSFYIKERGTKNLGVYDPRRIKSAIGNRGTYDINEPDINKKNGGITHAHQLDIEERPL
jgi:hypothetical protein